MNMLSQEYIISPTKKRTQKTVFVASMPAETQKRANTSSRTEIFVSQIALEAKR